MIMKVIINDVEYAPIKHRPEGKGLEDALEVRFDSDVGFNVSVREYLEILLLTLWDEEEQFNSKRPFGNSGWKYQVINPLVRSGFIPGTVDEDGDADASDMKQAKQYVKDLIRTIFIPPTKDNIE